MIPMIVLAGADWITGFPDHYYADDGTPLAITRAGGSLMGFSLIDSGYLGVSFFDDFRLGGHWTQFGEEE